MRADTALLDLQLRRRSLISYTLGIALYAFTVVALYPSFKSDASLNSLTSNGNPAAALFGATGSLTSATGWLSANLYANFLPLIALLLTIGYGAATIAGQDEAGTLALIATLPLSRRRLAGEKLATMCLLAAPVPIATFLCALAGPGFDMHVNTGNLIGATVGVVLLSIDFGVLAMLIGAATGSRSTALGITSAVAAASYIISSLAAVVRWIHPLRYLSPFYYAVGSGQLMHGISLSETAVLAGIAIALGIATIKAFQRLDIH